MFKINNTFTKKLPADKIIQNYRRQVIDACFSYVNPKKTSAPKLIHYSSELSKDLGLSSDYLQSDEFLQIITGNKIYEKTHPYAMCYGGHQFGNWAGQLGDGRAINLFEITVNGKQWALQLKGAGETPYSRNADGLAVLRSSIREYLCSEAMFHLNVPTTRALSLALSGDQVLRDMMYNGNPEYEKGAIVCRVTESFIRFGNFEILTARKNITALKQLADYTISHFYKNISSKGKQKYLDFLAQVRDNTIKMLVEWHRVGFIHGVMNTDNMSILGLTIDYGPYGWLDNCDYNFTPNTTDAREKIYRFGNQPERGLFNILKLANALYPLIEEVAPLQKIVDEFQSIYTIKFNQMMFSKLGLSSTENTKIISDLEEILHLIEIDYTIFFRELSKIRKNNTAKEALTTIKKAFYFPEQLTGTVLDKWISWFAMYLDLLNHEQQSDEERKTKMNLTNPKYIFRNYMGQLAIDQAEKEDYSLINEFYNLFKNPYDEQPESEKWYAKRPEWARTKIGCSMLSCSS